MATAWLIPGMDSPCIEVVGDISAPVAAIRTLFQVFVFRQVRICPASTLAAQPQPEPPQWVS